MCQTINVPRYLPSYMPMSPRACAPTCLCAHMPMCLHLYVLCTYESIRAYAPLAYNPVRPTSNVYVTISPRAYMFNVASLMVRTPNYVVLILEVNYFCLSFLLIIYSH